MNVVLDQPAEGATAFVEAGPTVEEGPNAVGEPLDAPRAWGCRPGIPCQCFKVLAARAPGLGHNRQTACNWTAPSSGGIDLPA